MTKSLIEWTDEWEKDRKMIEAAEAHLWDALLEARAKIEEATR